MHRVKGVQALMAWACAVQACRAWSLILAVLSLGWLPLRAQAQWSVAAVPSLIPNPILTEVYLDPDPHPPLILSLPFPTWQVIVKSCKFHCCPNDGHTTHCFMYNDYDGIASGVVTCMFSMDRLPAGGCPSTTRFINKSCT